MSLSIHIEDLSTEAYKKVKAMILTKELVPGQKIVQEKLAEDLGISRTPLRSALQMLEGEGLIESRPRRGMIVRVFSDEEALEIYDCRIALECMAVSLFTKSATDVEIAKLKAIFEPFHKGRIDAESYRKEDLEFHSTIMQGCGNRYLARLSKHGNLLTCIEAIGLVRPPSETLPEHVNIIKAIEDGDAERAAELMKEHLVISKDLIISRRG